MKTVKPARGRPRNQELDNAARQLAVTRRQAARVLASGADVGDLKTAKLRKLNLEADRLETQIAILRGEYFPKNKIYEHFLSAFTVFKAELLQLETTFPPMLAGLTETEMQPKIRAALESALNNLSAREWPL